MSFFCLFVLLFLFYVSLFSVLVYVDKTTVASEGNTEIKKTKRRERGWSPGNTLFRRWRWCLWVCSGQCVSQESFNISHHPGSFLKFTLVAHQRQYFGDWQCKTLLKEVSQGRGHRGAMNHFPYGSIFCAVCRCKPHGFLSAACLHASFCCSVSFHVPCDL